MEVARLCAEANEWRAPDKRQLLANPPFSAATFSKLAQIGADRRLQSPRFQKLLPPSYSTIYEVKQLGDEEFKIAKEEGIITPRLKRADLQKWRESKNVQKKSVKPRIVNLPDAFFAAIKLVKELSANQLERLDGSLNQIQSECNAEIVRPRDPMEHHIKAMGRYYTRVDNRMRIGARRVVREMKQRTLKANKKWHFNWEETHIDRDADLKRIQEVLDNIGRPDELSKLREAAQQEAKEPTPLEPSQSEPNFAKRAREELQRRELERQITEGREREKQRKPNREDFAGGPDSKIGVTDRF
jgi:hypothetical protein